MHSKNEHLSLFRCIFNFLAHLLKLRIAFATIFLSTFAKFLSLQVNGRDSFEYRDVERCLTKLVEHEKVMGQVGELRFEGKPIRFVPH